MLIVVLMYLYKVPFGSICVHKVFQYNWLMVVLYGETPLVQNSADFSDDDDGKTIITEVLHCFRPVLSKQLAEVKA